MNENNTPYENEQQTNNISPESEHIYTESYQGDFAEELPPQQISQDANSEQINSDFNTQLPIQNQSIENSNQFWNTELESQNLATGQNGYDFNTVPPKQQPPINYQQNNYNQPQNQYSDQTQAYGYNNYNNYNAYGNNQINTNQQQPYAYSQQTQWSYDNAGNLNTTTTDKTKKKKGKSKNKGLKIFAAITSTLFVLSIITIIGLSQGFIKPFNSNNNTKGGGAQLKINDTPDFNVADKLDESGRLATPAINKIVNPSVVAITTYTKTMAYQPLGEGSGVVMSEDGYIITNAHVVSGDKYTVDKIEVLLSNKKTYTARLVGVDTKSDLAVLKISATGLTAATFGDSSKLQVGETIIAIGNPNGVTFAGSLSQGVVSAVDRQIQLNSTDASMRYIQIDAAINPGNSGGALINQYAQVIGINTAKIVSEGYEGIGFAIPINIAKPIVDAIIKNGYVKGRVKIGISYTPVTQALAELNGVPVGLRVVDFDPDSDVAKKGIQRGDIITKIDNTEVFDAETIAEALKGKKPGDTIKMTIFRIDEQGNSQDIIIDVTLGEDIPEKTQ